ncbi:S8 family serine peptidase [bacterium]|nr:S8 family serine peptidase [bacterium]
MRHRLFSHRLFSQIRFSQGTFRRMRVVFPLFSALGLALCLFLGLGGHAVATTDTAGANSAAVTESDPEEIKVKGWVVSAPQGSDHLGEWRLRDSKAKEWRVLVTANTKIRPPVPLVGQWAEVEGTTSGDGSIVAAKVRSDEFRANQVIVRLDGSISITELADNYDLDVVERVLESANIFLLAGSDTGASEQAIVNRLKRDEHVVWAELNYVAGVPVADPYQIWKWGGVDPDGFVNQSAYTQIELPPVQHFYRGHDVIVAILDTGVSLDHPQLAGHLVPGIDLVDDDGDPSEALSGAALGHGTHVAGVIAHIAPNSAILPMRVLDGDGRGELFVLAYAIEWAVQQGADVINLSLGTPYDSEVLRAAVDSAVDRGVVVVAAAGNENGGIAQYPAAYANVLAVTAVDAENRKADFANYSEWVDIAAPGVGITSTIVGPEGNGFASWSGTSMATSFVSGVAALNRSLYPHLTAEEIYDRMIHNSLDLNALNPDYQRQIGGLVSALRTLGEPIPFYLPMLVR